MVVRPRARHGVRVHRKTKILTFVLNGFFTLNMSKARTYKDAIAALNLLQSNFALLEAKRQIGPSVDKNEYSIKVVYEYIRRLGYSVSDFNKLNVIHVTGTKGKGSTCAFTESILMQYRSDSPVGQPGILKIGLFTSPHLKSVRERIRINGSPIPEHLFTKYFFEVWDKLSNTTSDLDEFPDLEPCDKVKPMYFKYLTVLSFHIFVSEGVNTAIYEVGVGGKYDSTNIVPQPTVTGISALGIDHVAMLGDTIESIAWNKTGIFKPNVAAYVSRQTEYDIEPYIATRATELGVSSLEFVDPLALGLIDLGLKGEFQYGNAALAVKLASRHLSQLGITGDLPNTDLSYLPNKFKMGLELTQWDGRCQKLLKPDFKDIDWYVDGAHTAESIKVCTKWINLTKFGENREKVLIFNQQGRENAVTLLKTLHQGLEIKFDKVIFTTNITWTSGYNSELVSMNNSKEAVDALVVQKGFAETWKQMEADSEPIITHDIEQAISLIKPNTDVFVCGSLHLVGGVMTVLDNDRD